MTRKTLMLVLAVVLFAWWWKRRTASVNTAADNALAWAAATGNGQTSVPGNGALF